MDSKETVINLLKQADIKINGKRPFDIKVHNDRFYDRVISQRELGLGESYMDGWWDCDDIPEFITRLLGVNIRQHLKVSPSLIKTVLVSALLNRQSNNRAKRNASHHYNIGNDLYERMLDDRMIYSCGYWKNAKNLNAAQEAKLDLICQKLHLKKGMTLLDIGCGWGGFAAFAAKKYGVKVTGISPAHEQVVLAKERTKGLSVEIRELDYRNITGSYDRIVSIGMLEHVGPKNYKKFFDICFEHLKEDGIMLHHTIGFNYSTISTDPWIDKYIFPGGVIPSMNQISKAIEKKLIIEDVHSFGPYYDKTLMAWYANFIKHYPEIKDKYDERFYRMWTFYLQICAGGFRARHLQLWQIVMRKQRRSDAYVSVR